MNNTRFNIIYESSDIDHTENCPVLMVGQRLLYDYQKRDCLAQLKFRNIYDCKIFSIGVGVVGYAIDGTTVLKTLSYNFKDLNLCRDDECGDQTPLYLNNHEIKKIEVTIIQVSYEQDNKQLLWENNDSLGNYSLQFFKIEDRWSPELLECYQRESKCNKKDIYYLGDYGDIWTCSCGSVNSQSENVCHKCGKSKQWIKDSLSLEYLTPKIEKKQQRDREQKEYENHLRKKKHKILSIIIFLAICIPVAISNIRSLVKQHQEEEYKKEFVNSFQKDIRNFYEKKVNEESLNKMADVESLREQDEEDDEYDSSYDYSISEFKIGKAKGYLDFYAPAFSDHNVESVEWTPESDCSTKDLNLIKKAFFKIQGHDVKKHKTFGEYAEKYDYYYYYDPYYGDSPLCTEKSEYDNLTLYISYYATGDVKDMAINWSKY